MSGFSVRPESLRQGAEGMDAVVDRLAEALEQFEGRLQGFGGSWGGDEIGVLIGELYLAIHDLALNCFESNGEVIGQFAEGLHIMADSYQAAEEDALAGFRQIQEGLGG